MSTLHTIGDWAHLALTLLVVAVVSRQAKKIRVLEHDVGRLLREYPVSKPAVKFMLQEWNYPCCGLGVLVNEQENSIMLNLKKGDVRTLRVKPLDVDGNATLLDGTTAWASTDNEAVSVEANADGLSATLRVLKANTDVEISVKGDGAQGDAVVEIVGTLAVHVLPTDAVIMTIAVEGEPAPVDPRPGQHRA